MKKKVTNLYQKAVFGVARARSRVYALCTGKAEGASHTMEILIAVIVVVAIGLIFKQQIADLVTSIAAKVKTEAMNLF